MALLEAAGGAATGHIIFRLTTIAFNATQGLKVRTKGCGGQTEYVTARPCGVFSNGPPGAFDGVSVEDPTMELSNQRRRKRNGERQLFFVRTERNLRCQ